MNRHVFFLAALALCMFACNLSRAADYAYSVTDLGTLGGSESYAFAINASGQIAGEAKNRRRVFPCLPLQRFNDDRTGTLGGDKSCAYGINAGDRSWVMPIRPTIVITPFAIAAQRLPIWALSAERTAKPSASTTAGRSSAAPIRRTTPRCTLSATAARR